MSFPFNATISRASNGTIELTPDNQFDLSKLTIGEVITVDAVEAPKAKKSKGAARKSAVATKKSGARRAKKTAPEA